MGNNTIYFPSPCGEGLGVRLLSRDRRPRLSATTFHLTLQAASLMRTDEGVCPYIEAVTSIKERLSLKQRDALLISKKRPSPMEKGVSLFTSYCSSLTRLCFITLYTYLYCTVPHSSFNDIPSFRRGLGRLYQIGETYISSWNNGSSGTTITGFSCAAFSTLAGAYFVSTTSRNI